jgi:hypothetical protein
VPHPAHRRATVRQILPPTPPPAPTGCGCPRRDSAAPASYCLLIAASAASNAPYDESP